MIISKDEYDTEFKFSFRNLFTTISSEIKKFPDKTLFFNFSKIKNFLDLSENVQNRMSSSSEALSDYGQYLAVGIPALLALIIPLNSLKIIALAPIKINLRTMSVLKLFVNIESQDIFSKQINLYSDNYVNSKIYVPKNSQFSFISIYSRMRGTKVVLRLLLNIAYYLTAKYIAKTNKISKLVNLLSAAILSLDNVNLVVNVLFMGTSIATRITWVDFWFIFIDFLCLIYFQDLIF